MLAKPIQGMVNDARYNSVWWPEWGERPQSLAQQDKIVRDIAGQAPRLIPIRGNRFISEEPHDRGNPVFSVMGGDIIYYGSDLDDFLRLDGGGFHGIEDFILIREPRRIPFWSDAVERGCGPTFKVALG